MKTIIANSCCVRIVGVISSLAVVYHSPLLLVTLSVGSPPPPPPHNITMVVLSKVPVIRGLNNNLTVSSEIFVIVIGRVTIKHKTTLCDKVTKNFL